MPTLEELRPILTGPLGFASHHIVDGDGKGVAPEQEGVAERAAFVVRTQAGNCYACFRHPAAALSEVEANRYKAVSLLMPGGPAAYSVVEVGGRLRLFAGERGNELSLQPLDYDRLSDAEEMVRELGKHAEALTERQLWARRTLGTDNSLGRFVQILKGCWQDIWDIQNKRNDWIFDEFTKILFIKLHEDAKEHAGAFTLARLNAYCKEHAQMGAEAAPAFINGLFDDLKAAYPEVFTDKEQEEKVSIKAETIRKVMERLKDINLRHTEGDVLGRAFEVMLSDTFKGKDLGQFFTPREVVRFMLDLARDGADRPVLDLEKKERCLDAVAGSGGFLIAVFEDLYKHLPSPGEDEAKRKRLLRRLCQETIFACEIEEKAARLGKLNLIIHAGDRESARSIQQNYHYNDEYGGLSPEIAFEVNFGDGPRTHVIGPSTIDLVLTNPPFGKAVKTESILKKYDFGSSRPATPRGKPKLRASQDSEVLFIEHYLRVLKPGGKLLIVLPDGVLSNASARPVRDYIREQAIIKAVISLPSETFASTGTSIPTNVVYLHKKRTGDVQGDIFMARADGVGRRANGDPDPKNNDLPFILTKFREWQAGLLTAVEGS